MRVIIIAALFLSGCATLTPEGRMVQMFKGEEHPSCKLLGAVSGNDNSLALDSQAAAQIDIRNKTAKLGGNFVRVTNSYRDFFYTIEGDAFDCGDDVRLVHKEPTAEEKIAYELQRRNEIEAAANRQKALQSLSDSLTQTQTPAQQQKQTDLKCVRDCRANGYSFNLCESRCSY